jgi:hypothetical protein
MTYQASHPFPAELLSAGTSEELITLTTTLVETEEQVLSFVHRVRLLQKKLLDLPHSLVNSRSTFDQATSSKALVLGVDCEGISRQRNLALIQVSRLYTLMRPWKKLIFK